MSPIIAMLTTSNAPGFGYALSRGLSFGIGYDYLPSDADLSSEMASVPRDLFILSGYPSSKTRPARRGMRIARK